MERTERALLDALFALVVEKGYDGTTVQNILDRADVGRSTFYAHFFNKQDLLLRRMSLFRLNVEDCRGPDGMRRCMPDVTHLFEHVADQRYVLAGLRQSKGMDAAMAIARADLVDSFQQLFRSHTTGDHKATHQAGFLAQFFAGALLHLLIWWLDQGMPETPQMMNQWFTELGARAITGT